MKDIFTQMNVDYIIVGQGLCGTWLSYFLWKENKSFVVIDNCNKSSASRVASGLINPVTGRRVVTTWMADELLPFCEQVHKDFENDLNQSFFNKKNILVFPSAPDLLQAFRKRIDEQNAYVHQSPVDKTELNKQFNFPFDAMQIAPCFLVNVLSILNNWRNFLINKNVLLNENFIEDEIMEDGDIIHYKNIIANKIIYCNGVETAKSKYWKNLPFVQNKGEALIVDMPFLSQEYIYKFSHLSIIPWQNNLWWVGSNNELNFMDANPSESFYQSTTATLKHILKTGFEVKEHLASIRPAAVERRPFVGIHPTKKQFAILNGMGAKGCSLAPWFAKELTENLIRHKPINILADVNRYANILKR